MAALFTAGTCVLAVFAPWLGVLAYYLYSVGQMQTLWAGDFGDARVSLIITAATLIGLCGATAIKAVNYRVLFHPHSVLMLILLIWVNLSVSFSDFIVRTDNIAGQLTQQDVLVTFNKIMVFWFISTLLIDTRKKLEWLIYLLALILAFYTYWANKVYLTGEFWLFGDNGRLGGPPNSIYFDENYLAMLYVLATPVLYYLGIARQNLFIRYGIWLIIPLSWHALFLTGSRGGLVSLAAVCIYIFFRSYNKLASIAIVVGLLAAIIFQSGQLLNRIDNTIDNAIDNQPSAIAAQPDQALDPRLVSWLVGLKIIKDYPGFGVGVENFMLAFPQYSNTERHVAHNTFLQFAANCGLLTGLILLWHFAMRFFTLFGRKPAGKVYHGGLPRDYLDDLINGAFVGIFFVAVFLDLMIYELLYLVLLLGFIKYSINRKASKPDHTPKDSIYRLKENNSTEKTNKNRDPRAAFGQSNSGSFRF